MKALLLNSGLGSRMGGFNTCKCLAETAKGTTIFDAQVQSLMRCGVTEIYITTGAYADDLESHVQEKYPNGKFVFIHNPLYAQTNYIYSMQLTRDFLYDSDIVLMHGDLVFEQNVLQDIIASAKSCMVVDSTQPLPPKDFKAVVQEDKVVKVGVDFFTNSCYAQPLYKLQKKDWNIWLGAIDNFCLEGKIKCYAEDALNSVSHLLELRPLDISGRLCFEVDNPEDLCNAKKAYAKMPDRLQDIYTWPGASEKAKEIATAAKKPFIVCEPWTKPAAAGITGAVFFGGFTPNPEFEQAMTGIRLFEKENCDFIISIGGGSAIDVAKSVNILSLGESIEPLDAPRAKHLAIPTTAGTGSESTKFAVLYRNGEKHSIESDRILPEHVILDPEHLATLPLYHKKSALLDALCQAVESLWAKGRTHESQSYANGAIRIIMEDAESYLANNQESATRILYAANLAGKAINIGKTTAAHAMSYKLSARFGLSHGHAVALCLPYVWEHLMSFDCLQPTKETYSGFMELLAKMEMFHDFGFSGHASDSLVKELVESVNPQRLSNHPVPLSESVLADMYCKILTDATR
jgi:alcohol dehydrogenase class IV/choline kinase